MNRIDSKNDNNNIFHPSSKRFKEHHTTVLAATTDDSTTNKITTETTTPPSPTSTQSTPTRTIDVIIPCHNSSTTIIEALESVVSQTYPHDLITCCIYDDASSDNTLLVIRNFVAEKKTTKIPIKFCVSASTPFSESKGAGFARNEAVKLGTSSILALLDSDDVMQPERLALQADCLGKSPDDFDKKIVGCKFFRLPANSTSHYTEWANSLDNSRLYLEQFRECTVLQPTWMLSRRRFENLGGYLTNGVNGGGDCDCDGGGDVTPPLVLTFKNENPNELRLAEDLRLFHAHLSTDDSPKLEIAASNSPLLMYRHQPHVSLSSQTPRKLIMKLRLKAFEERVLKTKLWKNGFVIWGAGRDGKDFVKNLSADLLGNVRFLVDIDEKKINAGYHNRDRNIHLEVKPFSCLGEEKWRDLPVVVCVAMYRTDGILERNVRSINREEGKNCWFFF